MSVITAFAVCPMMTVITLMQEITEMAVIAVITVICSGCSDDSKYRNGIDYSDVKSVQ